MFNRPVRLSEYDIYLVAKPLSVLSFTPRLFSSTCTFIPLVSFSLCFPHSIFLISSLPFSSFPLFSHSLTLYDTAKPARPGLIEPLPKTAKKAARVTTEYPINSKRIANLYIYLIYLINLFNLFIYLFYLFIYLLLI